MVRTGFYTAVILAALVVFANPAGGASLKTLHSFSAMPDGALAAAGVTFVDGVLYGTTVAGGTSDHGTVYAADAKTGAETVLYSFAGGTDGAAPEADLLLHGGMLYGTTASGGAFDAGTVFRIDPSTGAEAVLHSFGSGTDGVFPAAGLTFFNGAFYGTTAQGGTSGNGIVFRLDATGMTETVLHNFTGGADGVDPFARLTALDGRLYGTTFFGGASNNGTVFAVDPSSGAETVLHAFRGKSFEGNPSAALTAANGLLYGTTSHGGSNACHRSGCGTVFAVDPATGKETILHSFLNHLDGQDPEGGLVYRAGFLYGSTEEGGRSERGTVFRVDVATSTEVVLHDFEGIHDGTNPTTLIFDQGKLFGTTRGGGTGGFGTVFRLKP